MNLDHVTIRTRDLQATRSFFLRVFDLEEGERPRAIQRIPGHWLYSEGHPLVHIIGSQESGMTFVASPAWIIVTEITPASIGRLLREMIV